MAFPTTILLPDNRVMTISGAARVTKTPRWFYGAMRRDVISAGKLGNAHDSRTLLQAAASAPSLSVQAAGSGYATNYALISSGATAAAQITALEGATSLPTRADRVDTLFDDCDEVTHTASRPDPILKDVFEYWASATQPGIAFNASFGGTSGSAELTLASNSLVTVGQKIDLTGLTGIFVDDPSEVYVVAVKHVEEHADSTSEVDRSGMKIVVSVALAASFTFATNTTLLPFVGSELIAAHTADGEYIIGGTVALIY